jgi:LEA14-like dessication related protein
VSPSIAKGLKIFGIVLIVILLLAGVTVFVLVKSFKTPRILASENIITFTKDGKLVGNTSIHLENDNSYGIKIDSLAYTMSINGKTYLRGHKDHPVVLKAHGTNTFVVPYTLDSKTMDKDFANQDSAMNDFKIDGYITALGFKKVHISVPLHKKLAFFKKPELIGDQNSFIFDSTGEAHVKVRLKLANRNKYPIQVDSFRYSLAIEGRQYVRGSRLKSTKMKALDTIEVNLPLTLDYKKMLAHLKGRDSAMHNFLFTFLLTTPDMKNGHFTLPLDRKLPLVTEFKVKLGGVKIDKLNFKEAHLTAKLTIGNPNATAFDVKKFYYQLKVEGNQWAEGYLPRAIHLDKKSSITLDVPVDLDFKKIKANVKEYFKGDKVQKYKLIAKFSMITKDPKMKEVSMYMQDEDVLHLKGLLKKNK